MILCLSSGEPSLVDYLTLFIRESLVRSEFREHGSYIYKLGVQKCSIMLTLKESRLRMATKHLIEASNKVL